jgi:hypothetical protein
MSFGSGECAVQWAARIWRCSTRRMPWLTPRCICSSTCCTAIPSRSTCTRSRVSSTARRRRGVLDGVAPAALRYAAAAGDGELSAGGIVVRVPAGSGSAGGSGATAGRDTDVVRGVWHVARGAAISRQQGRTVAALEPAGIEARCLASGPAAADSVELAATGTGHEYGQQPRGLRGMVCGEAAPPRGFAGHDADQRGSLVVADQWLWRVGASTVGCCAFARKHSGPGGYGARRRRVRASLGLAG